MAILIFWFHISILKLKKIIEIRDKILLQIAFVKKKKVGNCYFYFLNASFLMEKKKGFKFI